MSAAADLRRQIGEQLREARRVARLTQQDVADAACMSLRNLQRIERGDGCANLLTLSRVAGLFGLSLRLFVAESQ